MGGESVRALLVAAVWVVGAGAVVMLGFGAVRVAELGVDYLRTRSRGQAPRIGSAPTRVRESHKGLART